MQKSSTGCSCYIDHFQNGNQDSVYVKAVSVIEAHLFEHLSLSKISKKIGSSQSTLIRSFKKYRNQTPYSYIKNRRLEEAQKLLGTGRYAVGEVALLVGYSNFGAFTDAFSSKYGQTPSEYRNHSHSSSI
jgi:transcriptional regulator GlxA family with amidase domain